MGLPPLDQARIGIVGLGYVGLPLAVEFAKHFDTVGFDVKRDCIADLRAGRDNTRGITSKEFADADRLQLTDAPEGLLGCDIFIVTVPTPIDAHRQRDVNIALINELAVLFDRLGLDTEDVFRAAVSKWNFLPFRPGLVGGHCIGVDPYYLTHKAQCVGHHPEMILAGRRLNDSMGEYIAARVIKLMLQRRLQIVDAEILVLVLAFRENCSDLRNTRSTDIIREFRSYSAAVTVHDPNVDADKVMHEYGLALADENRTASCSMSNTCSTGTRSTVGGRRQAAGRRLG